MQAQELFSSFMLGGFECSTHNTRDHRRLDLVQASGHDNFLAEDYALLRQVGVSTVREGLRWHLIEAAPGRYDFSSVLPIMGEARKQGVQVIWDLCHYGWPDYLDIYKPDFVEHFARFAGAFARLLGAELPGTPFICPVNEISFFAWAGGDAAYFNPLSKKRGPELKMQLVRACIQAIEAVWGVLPEARICLIDPVINVLPNKETPVQQARAKAWYLGQYEAWDMIAGRQQPEIGGKEKYLDILGLNYYSDNQWLIDGTKVRLGDPRYKSFHSILCEVYARYKRPMFVAETGHEDEARVPWLRYIGEEARAAMLAGVDLHGVCLYPVLNHPGWDDDRHCHNGLLDYSSTTGEHALYSPLAAEVQRQAQLFSRPGALAATAAHTGGAATQIGVGK